MDFIRKIPFTNIALCGILAFSIFLFLSVSFIAIADNSSDAVCQLSESRPKFDFAKLNSVASRDHRVLASLVGHLKYDNGTKMYLPIALRAADLEDIDQQDQVLKLASDCATLTLHISTDFGIQSVDKIEVEARIGNDRIDYCSALGASRLMYLSETHFVCKSTFTFDCKKQVSKKGKWLVPIHVAELNLDFIEFELDGQSGNVKDGIYTRPRKFCNTTLFSSVPKAFKIFKDK